MLCFLCLLFPDNCTHPFGRNLFLSRSGVDFRGRTTCKNAPIPIQCHLLSRWDENGKFVVLAAEQLGELLGSCWGWLRWPNIQQLIGSRVWWELPWVLFAAGEMLRSLGLSSCNGCNVVVLNCPIDERCLAENEDSGAAWSTERMSERMV